MNDVSKYYDALIDINNDPLLDPPPLRDYMDKWDGREFIEKMQLSKTKSVLEIGVGTGRLAIKVAPDCLKFTGVDISEKTIERAKQNLFAFDNITLIKGDFLNIEFSETFHVIYSSLTFMHIKQKQIAICKVAALLKEGGIFVLSIDKNKNTILDAGISKISVFPDNPSEIQNYIACAGLTVVEQFETEFAHIFISKKLKR